MQNNKYAAAVATVRAKENELLQRPFFEQLVSLPTYESAVKFLLDAGISNADKENFANERLKGFWQEITEICGKDTLGFLVIKNDFHNIKAAIKCSFAGETPDAFFEKPCLVDTAILKNSAQQKDFSLMPSLLSNAASLGYSLLASTMNGQAFDMLIDKESINGIIKAASIAECDLADEIAKLTAAQINIKIALRASRMNTADAVLQNAFSECELIDVAALKKAALKSTDDVLNYISENGFKYLAEAFKQSASAFELAADNAISQATENARYTAFGLAPIIGYYIAKETECKNLRLVINAKRAGVSAEKIKERLREIYV